MFVEEKKADYGSKIATFGVEYNYRKNNKNLFVVLNKVRGKGKYQPVYKTDCKTETGGRYVFTDIEIDTDTLFNEDDEEECLLQIYKYKEKGNHKRVCEGKFNFG